MCAVAAVTTDSTVAVGENASATAAAMATAPSWQKPTSCWWMRLATLYAWAAAWPGLQAFTMPMGEMHMAELELGMLPRAAMRGMLWRWSLAAVWRTDWKNLPTFWPKISLYWSSQTCAQSS